MRARRSGRAEAGWEPCRLVACAGACAGACAAEWSIRRPATRTWSLPRLGWELVVQDWKPGSGTKPSRISRRRRGRRRGRRRRRRRRGTGTASKLSAWLHVHANPGGTSAPAKAQGCRREGHPIISTQHFALVLRCDANANANAMRCDIMPCRVGRRWCCCCCSRGD